MRRYLFILIFLFITVAAMAIDSFSKPVDMHTLNGPMMNNPGRGWRLSQELQENFNDETWSYDNKSECYYNSAHPTAIDSTVTFNYYSGTWNHYETDIYVYDPTFEYLNALIIDNNFTNAIYEYNDQHYLTEKLVWAYRNHYQYINNRLSAIYSWQWSPSNPSYHKEIPDFDTSGRIISSTNQVSPDSTNWVNFEHVDRSFHSHDTTTGDIFNTNFAHQYPLGGFFNSNPYGMVSQEIYKSWSNGEWINDRRYDYSYDASDKRTFYIKMIWNDTSWENEQQIISSYDINGNISVRLGLWWNPDSLSWENSYRVTYTWEQTTANDDQTTPVVKGLSLSAYPNPFQSHVDIQVNTKSNQPIQIEVFNIKGQSVYHAKAMPNTQITMDGKSLSSGIYFVKAKQGNETSVRKVLKLK